MELRVWQRIYLCPFIRVNLYTRGFTLSFGHRRLGWITIGRRGIRAPLDTRVSVLTSLKAERGKSSQAKGNDLSLFQLPGPAGSAARNRRDSPR